MLDRCAPDISDVPSDHLGSRVWAQPGPAGDMAGYFRRLPQHTGDSDQNLGSLTFEE